MNKLNSHIGINPFTVNIDGCPKLDELVQSARELRDLPFSNKLERTKELALNAMVNAYEQMIVWEGEKSELHGVTQIGPDGNVDNSEYEEAKAQHEKFRNIVFTGHPLSYALEQQAGCCRYLGALFFALGYEANLGDTHFVHAAPVVEGVNTVFNEIVHDGQSQVVSIFLESLKDKSLDYSATNPEIFNNTFDEVPGLNMYSYHRLPSGLVIVENPKHVREL